MGQQWFPWIWSLQIRLKLVCHIFTFPFLFNPLWSSPAHIVASFYPIKPLPSMLCFLSAHSLAGVGSQTLRNGTHTRFLSLSAYFVGFCLGSTTMTMTSPLLSCETPAWIKTSSEEMSVILQGDKLMKSSSMTAKEMRENWGQSYEYSQCLFLHPSLAWQIFTESYITK
jgi:hypothetical protein